MLRETIKKIIETELNPELASLKICNFLENELDLMGNGWFDDDEKLLNFINEQNE